MTTRRRILVSTAVIVFAAALAIAIAVERLAQVVAVMLLNTPDERDDLREQQAMTATTASRAPIAEPVPVLPDAEAQRTPFMDTAPIRTFAALGEPVKPRICRNSITGWPTYMVVDHCPCVDQRTKLPCADVSGSPIYGEEILMFTPSCEGTKNLPHCNPPLDFVLPNPHAPAHLRVPVRFSGEIKRKGQTYWQYTAGGRVLEEAQPFYVMP